MKRLFCLGLLCLFILSGCTILTAPKGEKPRGFQGMIYIATDGMGQADKKLVKEHARAYQKKHPGVYFYLSDGADIRSKHREGADVLALFPGDPAGSECRDVSEFLKQEDYETYALDLYRDGEKQTALPLYADPSLIIYDWQRVRDLGYNTDTNVVTLVDLMDMGEKLHAPIAIRPAEKSFDFLNLLSAGGEDLSGAEARLDLVSPERILETENPRKAFLNGEAFAAVVHLSELKKLYDGADRFGLFYFPDAGEKPRCLVDTALGFGVGSHVEGEKMETVMDFLLTLTRDGAPELWERYLPPAYRQEKAAAPSERQWALYNYAKNCTGGGMAPEVLSNIIPLWRKEGGLDGISGTAESIYGPGEIQ